MKHRIEVRVKNKEKVLDGRVMKLPARLVHWLLGDGMKVLVITPGDTVGHVDIYPEAAGKAAAKSHWGQTPLNTDKENKPGLKVL